MTQENRGIRACCGCVKRICGWACSSSRWKGAGSIIPSGSPNSCSSETDDLRALQSSEIDAVWVDEQKSLAPALAHLHAPAPAAAPPAAEPQRPSRRRRRAPAPTAEADRRAPTNIMPPQTVLADCRAAVGGLFAQVRSGDAAAAIAEAAPVVGALAESVERHADAMLTLTRIRSLDEYSYAHSVAVSALMIMLARQLQLPPAYVQQAGIAGLFMDVGKAFLPAALLGKSERLCGRGLGRDAPPSEARRGGGRGL